MHKIYLTLILIFYCFVYAFGNTAVDPAEGLVLSNNHVIFEFEAETMGLVKMIDRQTGERRFAYKIFR